MQHWSEIHFSAGAAYNPYLLRDKMLLYESVFMNEQTYSAAYKFYGEAYWKLLLASLIQHIGTMNYFLTIVLFLYYCCSYDIYHSAPVVC